MRFVYLIFLILVLDAFSKEPNINSLLVNIQVIENDLITLYNRPKNSNLRSDLLREIETIKSNIREIAKSTNQKESKDILEYLLYNIQKIKESTDNSTKISKDDLLDQIDSCKSMIEGANSLKRDEDILSVNKIKKIDIENIRNYYLLRGNKIDSDISLDQYKRLLRTFKDQFSRKPDCKRSFIKILEDKNSFLPNISYILSRKIEGSIDGK